MRTEAIVESFEASLREAFQQLQGGANAIPWWERKSLAQGMTESFVVGTASETAFLLVALLAKDPKWEVRAAIADLLPVLPEAESKRLTDQLMADSNTYVRRSVERAIERRKREIRAAGKARKSADQVSAQLQAIEDEFGKTAATKSLRMAERYSEMLVASIVHDLRSIMTHLKVNCYSLIEEVIADAGSQAKRYGVRVRNDLQLLESSVEDMVTFTRPVPTERFPERLAVLVAEALTLCGTTILLRTRSKLKWRILEVLNRRDLNGKWIGISGPEIAEILGLRSGQNGVSGAIRDFRTSICKILSAELGLICDQDDVIRSGGPGYRLNEWIRIEDGSQSKTQTVEDEGQSRRDRILELLAGGKRLRTAAIAESLGCSQATAKRELDFLRSTGAIEFIGPSKTGGYQLRLVMSE